jgi:hypothetical protein
MIFLVIKIVLLIVVVSSFIKARGSCGKHSGGPIFKEGIAN